MLTTTCIHPELIATLSHCGHGSKILIADGNYPLMQRTGVAKKVYLGLMPDVPTVTQVLEALLGVINVEKVEVMVPEDGAPPAIFKDFEALTGLKPEGCSRYAFYDLVSKEDVALAVSTGESRVYANILLTVGVR
ncbi:MAG: RbsD/FucU family protein [Clostridiaceae bacterium]|nr:RbsD/FucU family protein [Eubacteriales bacterium]